MNTEKNKISGVQLMFLVTAFVQGSILLTSFTVSLTKHDTWLVVLSGLILIAPFILSYCLLSKRFKGLNLIQIHDIVYGKYIGKAVSLYYIFFVFLTMSFNLRDLGDFYATFLMPDTPLIFFIVIFTLVCAFAVWKGIQTLGSICHLFVFTTFIIIASTFLLLLKDMDFSNFLPVFDLPLKNFIQGTHIISSIPYGELVIFLIIGASLKDAGQTTKSIFSGLLLGAISVLLVSIRNTAVLGSTETILISPSFQSVRLIDFGRVFTRMDLVIGIGQTLMFFIKSSLYYYVLVVSLSQLLGLRSYLPLILPIGAIETILALTVFESSVEHQLITISAGIIYSIPVIYIFPPLSLLISRLRNLPKQRSADKTCS